MKTSSKVTIPDGARKEIEFLFQHQIVSAIEEHDIPCSMIINIDQTPLKYVPTVISLSLQKGPRLLLWRVEVTKDA